MKYDKMVARNRAVSREKVTLAKVAIGELLRENEAVTVVSLVQKTGLSREFFYKNEKVRNCLARARENCLPSPEDAPVTTAFFPVRSKRLLINAHPI